MGKLRGFRTFVHKTIHDKFVKGRAKWFEHVDAPSHVIWPVEVGHIPSLTEGKQKLMFLRENGPSELAYDFKYKANPKSTAG